MATAATPVEIQRATRNHRHCLANTRILLKGQVKIIGFTKTDPNPKSQGVESISSQTTTKLNKLK